MSVLSTPISVSLPEPAFLRSVDGKRYVDGTNDDGGMGAMVDKAGIVSGMSGIAV